MVRGNTMEVTPTPAVGHGLIFCPSGRAGPTLAIRPGGSGDVTGTHVAWQTPRGSPFIPSPLVYGDYLYLVNDMTSIATCLEAKTGKLTYKTRIDPAATAFTTSPWAYNGKLFCMSEEGQTFVIAAGEKFQLLHVNALDDMAQASPALVGERLLLRTEHRLYSIRRKS